MKTAISIPDDLYEEAEALRKRLGLSRSELYAKAVESHLHRLRDQGVKAVLDRNHATGESRIEEEIVRYQASVLPEDDW